MKIEIKDARLEDISSINQIMYLSKAYWSYNKEFLDKFVEKFGITSNYLQKQTVKLLYVKDELAGFLSFAINADNLLELDNFFLHPKFIGQGLGRKFWTIACQIAEEHERKEFIIWSDPYAEGFYLKMGCEKIGVRPSLMMPDRFPPILKFTLKA